jgi:type I restriction enzyme M protein
LALDSALRSKVDLLWNKLWTGGLSNPMDAIEQFSYLLFLKRLDEAENQAQSAAERRGKTYTPRVPDEMRWRYWSQLPAEKAIEHVRTKVFPWFKELSDQESSFAQYMRTAEFKISKGSLLIAACKDIDDMKISTYEQDVQGDLYEHLLKNLAIAGRNGQFFTPRHIIRMMVKMIDPQPNERIGDLAAGTAGFLVHAYQHILEQNTPKEIIEYNGDGIPHHLTGEFLKSEQRTFVQTKALRGYDNDSGMTTLRIGSMNLMLHGIESPRFFYADTLSKGFDAEREFDVILMNPPFKGAVNADDINDNLPHNTTKSELLFLHMILRSLDMGGRVAVIVPDGVLFGSSRAHVEARRKIIEENRLDGVISMPSGVFKPYAGVSTAVLIFTRGAQTKDIWFYDMAHDGLSLDDKRVAVQGNDIPDILECWQKRADKKFNNQRSARVEELRNTLQPLKAERMKLHEEINRLRFESVLDGKAEPSNKESFASLLADAESRLAKIDSQIASPQSELDRLTRQFWVTKEQVKTNKYDLSASRYRQVDADATFHEKSSVTLERLARLEQVMLDEITELRNLL